MIITWTHYSGRRGILW